MNEIQQLKFDSPSFLKRIKGMLGVDFYRLFHTPLFYIFLVIAAIIPAMILGTSGIDSTGATAVFATNTWQLVAANTSLYVVSNIGEYANMNMIFIFGGIMVSIFIGNDYRSGYVKQLFTTHAKKQDYMISKTLSCAFAMSCMCLTYLLGTIVGGLFVGSSMEVVMSSLVLAIVSKMVLSIGWASLYTFINVILRKFFGISIASSFFIGTGILIIGVSAILGNTPLLNLFLYGSSVYACLNATPLTLGVCLTVSLMWSMIYIGLGTRLLSKSDVY